jgi:two-component system, cell cycle response regulator DivK
VIENVRPPPLVLLLGTDGTPPHQRLPLSHLQESGYRIVDHRGHDDSVEIARTLLPDVMLMDVVQGDQTTLDLCRRLQLDGDTRKIPLIAITGHQTAFGQFMVTLRIAQCDAASLGAEVSRLLADRPM